MSHRHRELRQTVANHRAVGVACLRCTYDVAIFVVNQPLAVGSVTCISPHIEVAQRLAFLDALEIVERIRVFSATYIIVVLTYILRVAEINEFVALCCANKVDVVREILRVDC